MMKVGKYLYIGLMALCLGASCADNETPETQGKEENKQEGEGEEIVSVYIPGVVTEDGYYAALWVDGKAHFVGTSVEQGFQTAPVLSVPSVLNSFCINGNDVYIAGHTTSAPGVMDYYENATIWKNGTIIFQEEQTNSVINDICSSGSDVYAVGHINGSAFLWKNGKSVSLPNELNDGKLIYPNAVAVSNGDCYIMGTAMYKSYPAEYKTFLWKNQELLDFSLDGSGLCLAVKGDDVYCLFEKDDKTYLSKNGEITDVGLKTWTGFAGPHFQTLFVDGEDVYIVGQQNGIAKIWKNGVISLLTTEENVCALTGIYVYDKDVYVVGYDFVYDENQNQSTVMKLWKNGKENVIDHSWSHAYPFGIVVASKWIK